MALKQDHRKWAILTLVILTNMFIAAIPTMGMSVLFKEISTDLGLNLVQTGMIWGAAALPGIITSLLGGIIGDKYGPRRILLFATLFAGLTGASRGLAPDFPWLIAAVLVSGALPSIVVINGYKICGQWFPGKQLGLANGMIAMGMALGFMLGSLLSATTFSPYLGGWRNVLIFYGLIGASFCILWIFVKEIPAHSSAGSEGVSIYRNMLKVSRVKNIWLLGMALFGVGGCVQGLLGYLPIYLRGAGWEPLAADGALSVFHTLSMVFVVPVALWSDRHRSRKVLLFASGAFIALGTGLLSFVSGGFIWAAVFLTGFVRDAFMAISTTMVIETDHVGPVNAGTATGLVMALMGVANFISPPLGNSFARFFPGAPFLFWSLLAVAGLVFLLIMEVRPVQKEA